MPCRRSLVDELGKRKSQMHHIKLKTDWLIKIKTRQTPKPGNLDYPYRGNNWYLLAAKQIQSFQPKPSESSSVTEKKKQKPKKTLEVQAQPKECKMPKQQSDCWICHYYYTKTKTWEFSILHNKHTQQTQNTHTHRGDWFQIPGNSRAGNWGTVMSEWTKLGFPVLFMCESSVSGQNGE